MKMYQWPIYFSNFFKRGDVGDGVFAEVGCEQIDEAPCACDLVFGGECNTPKSMPIDRFLGS